MFSIPIPALLISLVVAVGLCVHVVKTGQDTFWLWIILMFQPLGGLVYFVAIVLPSLFRAPAARKLREGAREALDPHRDYREAKAAAEDSPTVHNRMKLAAAAGELGRWDEAEALYAQASQGVHAEDPALRLGRAKALLELGRAGEALELLEAIARDGESTAPSTLAFARAYAGLQRVDEADRAYRESMERLPGLEAVARYAAFLRGIGRNGEARELIADIERRTSSTQGPFRREAQAWLDLAERG